MVIKGLISAENDQIIKEISVACGRLESQFSDVKPVAAREPLCRIYNDLSAVTAALITHLRLEKSSSQVVAALLRTLMEGCISTFAFCKDPPGRALMYHHFAAVLDWKWILLQERHVGCPFIPNEAGYLARMAERRTAVRQTIERYGAEYVKRAPKEGQDRAQVLAEVLQDEAKSANKFRDTWYPETRRQILAAEGMGWAYDVVYARLCSAVHADTCASMVLGTINRDGLISTTLEWWFAGLYRIVETFALRLSAEHMGMLRSDYEGLQGRR